MTILTILAVYGPKRQRTKMPTKAPLSDTGKRQAVVSQSKNVVIKSGG